MNKDCIGTATQANNRLSNLRWGTGVENNADSVRHGTRIIGEKHPLSKLKLTDVRRIRKASKYRGYYKAMAAKLGVNQSTVRRAAIGEVWRHVK